MMFAVATAGVIAVGLLGLGVWFAVTDCIRNGLAERGVVDFDDEDVTA